MNSNVINRAGWLVAGVLAIFVVAAMTGVVSGGPLDPPGPPAPTQKTLDQIAPVWSQVLAANDGPDSCHSSRFLCVMSGDAAVVDRETGLVWERVPSNIVRSTWFESRRGCRILSVGGRKGWRMPSEEEFESLVGALMPGHPFTFRNYTQSDLDAYWTATTKPDDSTRATEVKVFTADGQSIVSSVGKTKDTNLTWCVRGGAAEDGL